jgi:DNA-binding NarL/FixJ family response regulator
MTTLDPEIRLTNFQGTDGHHQRPVPEWLRLRHAPESREFAARELAREGFSDHAIADAINLDVNAVRKMIGADL